MKIIEEVVYKSKQEMSWRVTYGFREQLSTYRPAVIPGLITDNLFKCAFFFFFSAIWTPKWQSHRIIKVGEYL